MSAAKDKKHRVILVASPDSQDAPKALARLGFEVEIRPHFPVPDELSESVKVVVYTPDTTTSEETRDRIHSLVLERTAPILALLPPENLRDELLLLAAGVHECLQALHCSDQSLQDSIDRAASRHAARNLILDGMESERLREARDELQSFSYSASHDLKEPVRTVSSFLGLLSRRCEDQLDDEGKEFLGFALDGAARMKSLLDDLLAYSRVSTKGRELAPTDPAAALKTAQLALDPQLQNADTKIEFDAGTWPEVLADESQLAQVFEILLENALKFNEAKAPTIAITAELNPNGDCLFVISDNGIGIDPKDHQRVFDIYQRLHHRKSYSGTGTGLAIARKIIQRHRGRIWVKSDLGTGSQFKFTMKVA